MHFSEVVPAIFIGFLLNTVLFARLGEVARISVLRRKLSARGVEVPVPTMVGTLVTEQLLSGVTLIAVLLGVTVFVSVPGWAVNLLLVLIGVVLVIAVAACRDRGVGALPPRQRADRVGHRRALVAPARHQPGARCRWRCARARPCSGGRGCCCGRCSPPPSPGWRRWSGILWALEAYGIEKGIGAAALVFLASNLVGLFPIVPGNLVVFQGATYTALQVYNVPTNLAHHLLDRPAADRGGAGRRHRLLLPQLRGPVGGRAAQPRPRPRTGSKSRRRGRGRSPRSRRRLRPPPPRRPPTRSRRRPSAGPARAAAGAPAAPCRAPRRFRPARSP